VLGNLALLDAEDYDEAAEPALLDAVVAEGGVSLVAATFRAHSFDMAVLSGGLNAKCNMEGNFNAYEAIAARMSCLLCRGLLSCGPAVFAHDNDNDACSGAAQRAACCVRSCRWIRRCDGAGNCRTKHDRGYCRAHELFALPRLAFVRRCGVSAR
jgi:hypothetical protein